MSESGLVTIIVSGGSFAEDEYRDEELDERLWLLRCIGGQDGVYQFEKVLLLTSVPTPIRPRRLSHPTQGKW